MAGGVCAILAAVPAQAANAVQRENALPGTIAWVTLPAPEGAIDGYASETSVAPGGILHLHVSTSPAERYRIAVYRLGWYGGSGGRLIGCSPVACLSDRLGVPRASPPPDPITGEVVAGWPTTDLIPIPPDAVSGYYVARLVLDTGPYAGRAGTFPFVVTPLSGQRSAVLVQASVNTWEAYNPWGGKSLYNFNSTFTVPANHISFDRPYGTGAQGPFDTEIQLARFLEHEGVDVSYQTDVDTTRDPQTLLEHRLVMTAGHSEYWTKEMRDGFDSARDLGTNLAFMGTNNAYWQVRYEDGERTIVGYKSAADPVTDPALKTTLFRALNPPRFECELEGIQLTRINAHMAGPIDYTVTAAATSDPWFAGTGFHPGDLVKDVVGTEWDSIPSPLPAECAKPGLVVLFHYDGPPQNADSVRYTAPSGARVFGSGAELFSWGLDTWNTRQFGHDAPPNPHLQQFMRNALDDLTRPAAPQRYRLRVGALGVRMQFAPPLDPRIQSVLVFRHDGDAAFATSDPGVVRVCASRRGRCRERLATDGHVVRYAAVTVDEWGTSAPLLSAPVKLTPGTHLRSP